LTLIVCLLWFIMILIMLSLIINTYIVFTSGRNWKFKTLPTPFRSEAGKGN